MLFRCFKTVLVISLLLVLISCSRRSRPPGGPAGPSSFEGEPVVEWVNTFSEGTNTQAYCVDAAWDGGYILSGNANSGYSTYILKTGAGGEEEWSRTYDLFDGREYGYAVRPHNNGYTVGGYGDLSGDDIETQAFLFHVDQYGDSIWFRTYSGNVRDCAMDAELTSDGGMILAGTVDSHYGLIKTDAEGEIEWAQNYGDASGWAIRVCETYDHGFITIGQDYSIANVLLRKFKSTGDFEWDQLIMLQQPIFANDLQLTSIGGFALTGYTSQLDEERREILFIKTDETGGDELIISYRLEDHNVAGEAIQQTGDTGFVIAGNSTPFDTLEQTMDIILLKTDIEGNVEWNISIWRNNLNFANSMIVTDDPGFVVAGYTVSDSAAVSEALILKVGLEN